MKDRFLIAAVALVCLTNIVALAKAAWNRSSITSSLTLTERELRRSYAGDTSVTQLRINWLQHWPVRIDMDQAARLGFATSVDAASERADEYYRKQLPRLGYVVLEYDGRVWESYREQVLRREPPYMAERPAAERRQSVVERERQIEGSSRLFAIAVDGDAQRLRAAYPELSRYLIARARVALSLRNTEDASKRERVLAADVIELMPSVINVPRPFSVTVRDVTGDAAYHYTDPLPVDGRYVVDLKYGGAFEPWIADLRRGPR